MGKSSQIPFPVLLIVKLLVDERPKLIIIFKVGSFFTLSIFSFIEKLMVSRKKFPHFVFNFFFFFLSICFSRLESKALPHLWLASVWNQLFTSTKKSSRYDVSHSIVLQRFSFNYAVLWLFIISLQRRMSMTTRRHYYVDWEKRPILERYRPNAGWNLVCWQSSIKSISRLTIHSTVTISSYIIHSFTG